jgi:hypothetical protein
MAEALNSWGMTQSQWSQYVNEQNSTKSWLTIGPSTYMWRNKLGEYGEWEHATPNSTEGYNPATMNTFVSNEVKSSAATAAAVAKSNQVTNIDPQKQSGYKFVNPLNDAWTASYNKQKQSNPNLTEYQFRLNNIGMNNGGKYIDTATMLGTYVAPQVEGNRGSSSSTGTAKVEATSKVSASANAAAAKAAAAEKAAAAQKTALQAQLEANKKVTEQTGKLKVVTPTTAAAKKAATAVKTDNTVKKVAATVEKSQTVLQKQLAVNALVKENTGKLKIIPSTSQQKAVVISTPGKNVSTTQKKMNAQVKAIEDATGKIKLANGTWINSIDEKDSRAGQNSISLFTESTKEHYNNQVKQVQAIKDAAEAIHREYLAESGALIDKNGMAINQAVQQGSRGTGEARVVTVLKNGQEYERGASQTASDAAEAQKKINAATKEVWKVPSDRKYTVQTADEIGTPLTEAQLKQDATIAKGGLMGKMAALDKTVQQVTSYKNIAGGIEKGVNYANSKVSRVTKAIMPELNNAFVEKRNDAFRSVGLEDEREKIQKVVNSNPIAKAVLIDYVGDKYNYVRNKPASAAIDVGALVVGGEVLGAATEAGTLGLEAGGAKLALSKISAIKTAGNAIVKGVRPASQVGMVGLLAKDAYATGKEGNIAKDLDFAGSLLVGGVGYSKGVKAVKEPISLIPGLHNIELARVTGGETTNINPIKIGTGFGFSEKQPIISYSNGKLVRGMPDIDTKIMNLKSTDPITGKSVDATIQAFDKGGNKWNTTAFMKAVESTGKENVDHVTALKELADSGYSQKNPIVKPESFDLYSEHIPASAKDATRSAIVRTKGLDVYGSNTMKAQMGDYLTRGVKDLEIHSKSPSKIVAALKTSYNKAGLKEGKDFKIEKSDNAPKVYFKMEGKWVKGIEIFGDKKTVVEGYGKTADGIAFGYESLPSLKVKDIKLEKYTSKTEGGNYPVTLADVKNVKIMKLQESAGRKFAGSVSIKGGDVRPYHEGRIKDVAASIELSVGNHNTFSPKNTGEVSKILTSVKTSVSKYPELIDPKSDVYSPIIASIYEKGVIPSSVKGLSVSKNSALSSLVSKVDDLKTKASSVAESKQRENSPLNDRAKLSGSEKELIYKTDDGVSLSIAKIKNAASKIYVPSTSQGSSSSVSKKDVANTSKGTAKTTSSVKSGTKAPSKTSLSVEASKVSNVKNTVAKSNKVLNGGGRGDNKVSSSSGSRSIKNKIGYLPNAGLSISSGGSKKGSSGKYVPPKGSSIIKDKGSTPKGSSSVPKSTPKGNYPSGSTPSKNNPSKDTPSGSKSNPSSDKGSGSKTPSSPSGPSAPSIPKTSSSQKGKGSISRYLNERNYIGDKEQEKKSSAKKKNSSAAEIRREIGNLQRKKRLLKNALGTLFY